MSPRRIPARTGNAGYNPSKSDLGRESPVEAKEAVGYVRRWNTHSRGDSA
jgi:hypothetical protein